jgi:D-galactarolactone isomerase
VVHDRRFYEFSELGGPDFADIGPVARRVIANAPLWGSNWQHVGVARTDYPDDATLHVILQDCASPDDVEKILVGKPAKLYGF